MKYHLILTLDYEIFGDGSGCLDKCLLEPTSRILTILEEFNVPCTFYIDALEFIAIKKVSAFEKQYRHIEAQIKSIGNSQHAIGLHLHPQWMNARYQAPNWVLNFDAWRIGNLAPAEIEACVTAGLEFLQPFSEKQISSFRAGGWAIQPSNAVVKTLSEHGLKIDSTVAPGALNLAPGDWYNFLKTPDEPYWTFDSDICKQSDLGSMVEVPITTGWLGIRRHVEALLEARKTPQLPEGCTGSYNGPNGLMANYLGKFSKVLRLGNAMLDFSTLPAWALKQITLDHLKRFEHMDQAIPLVAICHNKNLSSASEHNLREYLTWISNQPDIVRSDFDRWLASND